LPWDYEHTLAGEFAKAGYYTQAVGKMHVTPNRKLCGFHNVILYDGYLKKHRRQGEAEIDDYMPWLKQRAGAEADIIDHGMDCNASIVARPWHLDESVHPTNWVVTQSIDFLRRRDPTMPFLLFMSFVAPHPPLIPPGHYLDMYLRENIPDSPVGDWAQLDDPDRHGLNPTAHGGIVASRSMLRQAKAGYYGLITHIDHQIGRFMIAMQEFGVLNNTIVLFVSDHGDMLGDHNLYRKSLPYEGSVNIPFILHDPTRQLNLMHGGSVGEPVELMDIMPTLLDAAGIPIPDTVEGSSVLPLARGLKTEWRDYIHGEFAGPPMPNHFLTDGNEKYILAVKTGMEQLFDLRNDPQELRDLSTDPAYAGRLKLWRGRLAKEMKDRGVNEHDS
jgi:arylsulfatase A-like enzyme